MDQSYEDAITSLAALSRIYGKLARQRDAALATIARVEALAAQWEQVGSSYLSVPEAACRLREVMDEVPL
jgi:hypothetical protein